jgi:hypothetical protein
MRSERPSSPPGDELNDSWFDRPGRRRRMPLPAPDVDPSPDSDGPDDLDDPWFIWSPEV